MYTPAPTTPKPTYAPTRPQTQSPYNPKPTYKPPGTCPWSTDLSGDCPGIPNKCNLKYFRVCGENFFNKVYNDICRWQDAKQLIPMFTAKLVPLGSAFESSMGLQCTGYGSRSIQDLLGAEAKALADSERDIPQCKPSAGAVPCMYVDFSEVTTARQFHVKMENLFNKWLRHHCNAEWQVHFRALLIRMRHSLFCDDGSQPDHPGYVVSTMPPQTTQPHYNPVDTPKPAPYNPPATPIPPTQAPYNPPATDEQTTTGYPTTSEIFTTTMPATESTDFVTTTYNPPTDPPKPYNPDPVHPQPPKPVYPGPGNI